MAVSQSRLIAFLGHYDKIQTAEADGRMVKASFDGSLYATFLSDIARMGYLCNDVSRFNEIYFTPIERYTEDR